MARILISTTPFGAFDRSALDLLSTLGQNYELNPFGRRMTEAELISMIGNAEVLIAGTEPITAHVMDAAPNLRLISRVGVGLDNVDLKAARERDVAVSYTPDAPAPAVAELTLALALSLLRRVHEANLLMHEGHWQRLSGRRVSEVTFGVIGVGRIGSLVTAKLDALGAHRILLNDLTQRVPLVQSSNLDWSTKESIYRDADVVTLHIPLTVQTRNLVCRPELEMMKSDALLINTSRGGVVNEQDLADVLVSGHLAGAAVDVFTREPYAGPLTSVSSCLLTSHMGSMSVDCRSRMEIEATEEVMRFFRGQELTQRVPETEFQMQMSCRP